MSKTFSDPTLNGSLDSGCSSSVLSANPVSSLASVLVNNPVSSHRANVRTSKFGLVYVLAPITKGNGVNDMHQPYQLTHLARLTGFKCTALSGLFACGSAAPTAY
jgi:hypothetical protein